jgi:hypothetical protein
MNKSMAYATGTKSAMRSTGDKPPLEKSTIKKAHKIAKAILRKEENEGEQMRVTEFDARLAKIVMESLGKTTITEGFASSVAVAKAKLEEKFGEDWIDLFLEEVEEDEEVEHLCAKHVYSDVFGEGVVMEGNHADPDEEGNIEWYTVKFDHGEETVFTEDIQVMVNEYHMHKKKKMSEEELDEKIHVAIAHHALQHFKKHGKMPTSVNVQGKDWEVRMNADTMHKITANKYK